MRIRELAGHANRENGVSRHRGNHLSNRGLEVRRRHLGDREILSEHRTRRERSKLPTHSRPGSARADVDHHEPLRLAYLGGRRPLDRPGVEHGDVEGTTTEIAREHLMAVYVTRQHRGELRRYVAMADHVGGARKREVSRPDRGTLDAVMKAQQAHRRVVALPTSALQQRGKARPYVAPLVREA